MQDLEKYKITDEEKRTVYNSALLPGNAALFLLHIEQMNAYDISGQLFNLYVSEPQSFHTLAEAITKIDRVMNEMDYPQVSAKMRDIHYDNTKNHYRNYDRLAIDKLPRIIQYWHPALFSHPVDRCAAVFIRVMYRQNSSWQGTVQWSGRDGLKQQQHFRSVLELMNIIQSAIAATDYASLEQKGISYEYSNT